MNEFGHEHHVEQARVFAAVRASPRIDPTALVKRFELRHFCVPDARLDFFWEDAGGGVPMQHRDRGARYPGSVCHRRNVLLIELSMRVPDRDSGGSGIFCFNRGLDARELYLRAEGPDVRVLHAVRGLIHEALLHEADEALHLDGVRVFDPHANDEKPAAVPSAPTQARL
ncbi:MAG TPA: hypothetical protein VG269_26735 [Tepidisphaeraceae bacterium]|jgi:hypothetical protein|nr:hypothetical protein [Tepidisphaeraceae bacterium]